MSRTHHKTLRREEAPGHARFLTFSCFRRQPLMLQDDLAARFIRGLARARTELRFKLYAWVVMPEHIHLLLTPDLTSAPVPLILNAIKAPLARSALAEWRSRRALILDRIRDEVGRERFWLPGGGYDRNIYSAGEFNEKLEYIHNNPVKRGLARRPPDYPWSSAGWYEGRRSDALVELDPIIW